MIQNESKNKTKAESNITSIKEVLHRVIFLSSFNIKHNARRNSFRCVKAFRPRQTKTKSLMLKLGWKMLSVSIDTILILRIMQL